MATSKTALFISICFKPVYLGASDLWTTAAALGGVAGHAGLFGTAHDLARYAAAWVVEDSRAAAAGLLPPALKAEALRRQNEGLGGRRGLG